MDENSFDIGRVGFTLIELLVVLTIMFLLFGLGYANYRDFARRQSILAIAREMRTDIRLAQEQALAGAKPSAGCNVLDGYRFRVDTFSRSYSIHPFCGGSELTFVKEVTLPAEIASVVVAPVSANPLLFKTVGQGNSLPSGGVFDITLTQVVTGYSQTITVTSGGEIK